jgi:hypothetical protein
MHQRLAIYFGLVVVNFLLTIYSGRFCHITSPIFLLQSVDSAYQNRNIFQKNFLQFQVDLNIKVHHVQLLEVEIVCNAHITCTTKLPLDNQKSKNGVVALRKLC